MEYYRTPKGLCYKRDRNGSCRRVSMDEYLQRGGAYSAKEQKCIDLAQEIITKNKALPKGTFKHLGHLVAASYETASSSYPDCAPFYASEKKKKDEAKGLRKKEKAKKRKTRSRSKSKKSKSKSKSRSKTKSKSRK